MPPIFHFFLIYVPRNDVFRLLVQQQHLVARLPDHVGELTVNQMSQMSLMH